MVQTKLIYFKKIKLYTLPSPHMTKIAVSPFIFNLGMVKEVESGVEISFIVDISEVSMFVFYNL